MTTILKASKLTTLITVQRQYVNDKYNCSITELPCIYIEA